MKSFCKTSPHYWRAREGRALRALGAEGHLLARYLMTGHATMIGIYPVSPVMMAEDVGLTVETVKMHLKKLCALEFCRYDAVNEYVWVTGMARDQLGDSLKPADKRVAYINQYYQALPALSFLGDFFDVYRHAFHLETRRANGAVGPDDVSPFAERLALARNEQDKQDEQHDLCDLAVHPESNTLPREPDPHTLSPVEQTPVVSAVLPASTAPVASNGAGDMSPLSRGTNTTSDQAMPTPVHVAHVAEITTAANTRSEAVAWKAVDALKKDPEKASGAAPIVVTPQHATAVPPNARSISPEQKNTQATKIRTEADKINETNERNETKEMKKADKTDDIKKIFNYWRQVMGHPNAQLDEKRHQLIAHALKSGYNTAAICQAILGCSMTPHNTGDNDRGQRYDGLHIILKDADQIDRFRRNAQKPPSVMNTGDRLTHENVNALQRWIDQNEEKENIHAVL